MAPDTQAMQNDDTANPGMLWVLDGEALWNSKAGAAGKACADCHGDARASMKGVAARYPAFDKTLGRPVNLEQRINLCRAEHQQATPLRLRKPRPAGADRLRRAAIARHADRGRQPIRKLEPFVAKGRELFMQRQGQLNLACANCHDDNWDKHLAGSADHARHTRPAIRCTGWNGNRSARCSAACAAASPASARSLTTTARRNWSSSSSI